MAKLVLVAYPADDPTGTALGTLTEASDTSVTVEDDGVGAGHFSISTRSSQAAWCEPGAYVLAYRDTVTTPADALAGFWIEDLPDAIVSSDEEGGLIAQRGGRGPIAYLAEAVVWHRARSGTRTAVQPGRRRWHWRDAHPGRVLVRMLEEARARGDIPGVTWDFSANAATAMAMRGSRPTRTASTSPSASTCSSSSTSCAIPGYTSA